MSDEQKKILSAPPPATDEIDEEWGSSPKAAPSKSASKSEPRDEDEDEDDLDDDDDRDDDDRDDDDPDDDDDLDDEEDDDEEEDEEDEPRRSRDGSTAPTTRGATQSQDWLPDWAPWAVLGGLVSLGFLGGLGAIPLNFDLKPAASAEPAAEPVASAAPELDKVAASHLLVSYKGSLRAGPNVTRTKDEALTRAREALARAKKGEDFAKLVGEFSDEPGAAARGGRLGTFKRTQMVKEFADAAFALKPGQLSDVVETKFGFHVILRTQ